MSATFNTTPPRPGTGPGGVPTPFRVGLVLPLVLCLLLVPLLLTFTYHQSVKTGVLGPETSLAVVLYGFLFVTLFLFYQIATRYLDRLGKQNQQQQHQTDLLMGIVDNGKAGITLFEPVYSPTGTVTDLRYVFTNSINSRNLGISVADMTGKTLLEVLPFMQGTDWFTRLTQTATTGESQSFLYNHHINGVDAWFDTLFVKIGDQVLFTDLNVTPLKEAELAVMGQNDLLERVMNTTPTAIVVHESVRNEAGDIIDFRMVRLNQVAAELLGNSIENIQFRRISQYFPGLMTEPVFAAYQAVANTGQSVRTEVMLTNRWYDFSAARFGDGVIVAVQDITPMRQARHQLELANHELKRSNESLQSFAYIASHDLQEPLRKTIAFADILHTQFAGEFTPEATDIIRRIQLSAGRMRSLVQDLLLYARVETQPEKRMPIVLADLLTELRENELWAAFQQTKAELHLLDLPQLLAAPTQLRQLFQNLVGNALKFRRPEVTPIIQVSSRTLALAQLPAGILSPANERAAQLAGSGFHEIAVADNGIGFEEQYTARIFQVFQRLHGQGQFQGSGVGLAICQKICERHGGAITAHGTPGVGSTFRVYLPARE